MKTTPMIFTAFLLSTTIGGSAGLAQGGGQGMVGTACQVEIAKHCAGVSHGRGAVPACLAQHQAELSEACKAALAAKGPGWRRGQGMGQGFGRGRPGG